MQKPILLFATIALVILASWLTFFDHDRYGTHGDGFRCGEVKDAVTYSTVTTYYLFSQPNGEQSLNVGTCPYSMFKARTYALDLWVPAILLGYLSQRGHISQNERSGRQ